MFGNQTVNPGEYLLSDSVWRTDDTRRCVEGSAAECEPLVFDLRSGSQRPEAAGDGLGSAEEGGKVLPPSLRTFGISGGCVRQVRILKRGRKNHLDCFWRYTGRW
jgi:hypothetical protein